MIDIIVTGLGIILLALGVLMELANTIWAFEEAITGHYKSPLVLVPLILNLFGVLLLMRGTPWDELIGMGLALLMVHFSTITLIPWLLQGWTTIRRRRK